MILAIVPARGRPPFFQFQPLRDRIRGDLLLNKAFAEDAVWKPMSEKRPSSSNSA